MRPSPCRRLSEAQFSENWLCERSSKLLKYLGSRSIPESVFFEISVPGMGKWQRPNTALVDDQSVALERSCVDSGNGTSLSEVSSDRDIRMEISTMIVEAAL